MLKKFVAFISVSGFLLLLAGCANNGMLVGIHTTSVELSDANFEIVAPNLIGQSVAAYVLGFSMSLGSSTQTMALARVKGTGMLYKEALEDLWKRFEAQYGKIEGRKLALTNLRYDSESLNLGVYTAVKVFIRADVIEFK